MIQVYGLEKIYQEAAFIGYYFHWSRDDVLRLSHMERARWCEEISAINKELNQEPENLFQV